MSRKLRQELFALLETWLNELTPDSSVEIPRFLCFRNDRSGRPGGGVCAYADSTFPGQRLIEHEDQDMESLWINIRPFKLPRCVSAILLGVIYHSTSCAADDNVALTDHIQKVSEAFLLKHPDGLIVINGDFNPTTTGISERSIKLRTGLSQITKVLTRDTGTLDWCLTNKPKLFRDLEQLPKIGRSDHYTVLIKPCESLPGHNHPMKDFRSRDLRTSSLHAFGRWITNFDWSPVLNLSRVSEKFDLFCQTLLNAIDSYLPMWRVKGCADKPWVSNKLRRLITQRQKALKSLGKDSPLYKELRNKTQVESRTCKRTYYENKVSNLKDSNSTRWWREI